MHKLHSLHYNKDRWGHPSDVPCFFTDHMKHATTVEEQISILKSRGMRIPDEENAKEILLDIGYYRLGFYWFPYEKDFPSKRNRSHDFKEDTDFNDAVELYYFDHDLRSILSPFLYRIEVNIRTTLIYKASNKYKNNPTWFADNLIVTNSFTEHLQTSYQTIRKNETIKRHHQIYKNDIYAPAWKTLEYMVFGDILKLIASLKDDSMKKEIAWRYGIKSFRIFENYMNTVRVLRNLCAHGHNIFDLQLQKSIASTGPVPALMDRRNHDLTSALLVVSFVLKAISPELATEMREKLKDLFQQTSQRIKNIIQNIDISLL